MERLLRLNEDVLRFLTIRVDEIEEGQSAILARKSEDRGERGGFRGPRPAGRFDSGRKRGFDDREEFRARPDRDMGRPDELMEEVSSMSETQEDVNPAARRTAVGARRPFYRRRKSCPFSGPGAPKIDYKDVRLLSRFLSGARQDRAQPHHGRVSEEAARAGAGHQARPIPRPAALRRELGDAPCQPSK